MFELKGYQRLAMDQEGTSWSSLQITLICALSVHHRVKVYTSGGNLFENLT